MYVRLASVTGNGFKNREGRMRRKIRAGSMRVFWRLGAQPAVTIAGAVTMSVTSTSSSPSTALVAKTAASVPVFCWR